MNKTSIFYGKTKYSLQVVLYPLQRVRGFTTERETKIDERSDTPAKWNIKKLTKHFFMGITFVFVGLAGWRRAEFKHETERMTKEQKRRLEYLERENEEYIRRWKSDVYQDYKVKYVPPKPEIIIHENGIKEEKNTK